MKYRSFGNIDWQASALGFGCMRLPTQDGEPGAIRENEAADMLHYAIDHGVNYLDTAYPYHDGQSEPFLGRVLQGKYREKVKLATKLPCWEVEEKGDFDRLLDEQLKRLDTEQIDFYLLHALNKKSWKKMHSLGVLSWLENARSSGRIAHIGFSFHDEFPVFKEIIDAYQGWEFCQIQYNYMDVKYQAGKKGLQYAADRGLAVVIMEPIRGGRLVDPPEAIQSLWKKAPIQRSPAAWALHWLWNQPEVSLVLSGMSAMSHVRENVAAAERSQVGLLTQEEQELVREVREAYQALSLIPCTQCEYCLPCPNGVNIPRILQIYNDSIMYDKPEYGIKGYNNWIPEEKRADQCEVCGECEEKCPQGIAISEWMEKIHQELAR
ncbi:MAG: aldo/keto reductase [Anaerolineales bacterium]|nr:aldo/keto reductase [Anaerolineales bacterium]